MKNKNFLHFLNEDIILKSNKIFIDGFPRSGNTFFSNALSKSINDKMIISHFHDKDILNYYDESFMLIILIREPKDVILSNIYYNYKIIKENSEIYKKNNLNEKKYIHDIIDNIIDKLFAYYNTLFINKNKNFIILNFKDFTNDINKSIYKVGKFYKLNVKKIDPIEILTMTYLNDKKNKNIEYSGHVPRKLGNDYVIIENLKNDQVFNDKLKKINDLYQEILNFCA